MIAVMIPYRHFYQGNSITPAYGVLPGPPTTGDMFTDMLLMEAWRNVPYLHAYDINGSYVGTYETNPIDSWHNGWKIYPSPGTEMGFTHPYLEIEDLPTLVKEIRWLVEEQRYVVELGILRQQDTKSNY
ncbi:hypothetical protein AGABI2DRAFT_119860 [Agaricus bisporus var. bisporus H97]|uniref:hypothetical protein n=1 Tax=Agaricus bisporus var. bisporus (strain H97 / ATCC MYA-4626 / FGSC 10389) TaxID=936046 RepID=UPI00029F5B9D|nr:hypothetical protein AGABI2DRAFT_119860 [Agaricus bisporus var. bisporus H97]EKV44904.1 hypothetical protein AGABI2DRAFT_119860 [Agaricus bisporus var. bisporus H97]